MLHPDKALDIIRNITYRLPSETVALDRSPGRVLAADAIATLDDPPFDKSAMDGYAVSGPAPLGATRRIKSTVAAGEAPGEAIKEGECVRIMTGAPVPSGTDMVIRREFTEEAADRMTLHTPEIQRNIIYKGENFKTGERLFSRCRIEPRHTGILASIGMGNVRVEKQPVVGIITTGSEILDAGDGGIGSVLSGTAEDKLPGDGQIFNSNGPMLAALTIRDGGIPIPYGIVKDNEDSLSRTLNKALGRCDVILFTGGVSMGDFDLVPGVLEKAGAEVLFYKLAVRPGLPTLLCRRGDAFIFGLPGNPVSVFVIYELFVRELFHVLAGLTYEPVEARAVLSEQVTRKNTERVEYRPGHFRRSVVTPLFFRGSSHLSSLADANCLYRFDLGQGTIDKDSEIYARLI